MSTFQTNQPTELDGVEPKSWTDLGQDLWSYLTGRGATINYTFVDMTVEVPRDTGADAPRATWRLNGTIGVTTSDDEFKGADIGRS